MIKAALRYIEDLKKEERIIESNGMSVHGTSLGTVG